MKNIKVVAAIICHNGKVFASQRGYGEYKDGWEFPGGKIEPGESAEEALKREIKEELATTIDVEGMVGNIEYDYPTFHLSMACYKCKVRAGHLTLLEHEAARWLTKEQLYSVNWLPADRLILNKVSGIINE
ncbi:MAG: (deoxy)nucleoside triphosphate pyrophosphohydrolase [Prevotella sp.]|jgi:8-oxo-dGTP diphosphatase